MPTEEQAREWNSSFRISTSFFVRLCTTVSTRLLSYPAAYACAYPCAHAGAYVFTYACTYTYAYTCACACTYTWAYRPFFCLLRIELRHALGLDAMTPHRHEDREAIVRTLQTSLHKPEAQ